MEPWLQQTRQPKLVLAAGPRPAERANARRAQTISPAGCGSAWRVSQAAVGGAGA